ncbi:MULTISPECIES: hypothetical protein [Pseudomonas]|jgi:hypothetical protein|uniref:Uncharacterized protein n=2 Tax=Pseudomonas TaxID=286 RepID=A0A4Y9THI6_PSEFL|nr:MULTISPECIES: hypothetical protein [Pseudomonas]CRM93452.1 hypothetical protein [Pseudomonas sp. 22 E 5]MCX9151856.1 hypothetical protein [Pseudomonas sp. TB1-B1]QXH68303.1 hypothetical protein KSS96_05060 [Pseudomonas asgharzadehiana]TFW43458.1 hypothetical protein E4T65_10500 [Pseudomonas fluorescens]TKJ64617.1 hypothetical protein PspCFBP13506_08780 [Pseudomonas sp. CFBP13506]
MTYPAPTLITSSLERIELQLPSNAPQPENANVQAILFERNPDEEDDLTYYESVFGVPTELSPQVTLVITPTKDQQERLQGKTLELGYRVTKRETSMEADSERLKVTL